MAMFLVRVQLNERPAPGGKPSSDDYQEIHDEMRELALHRFIESDQPLWYQLPHAMYYGDLIEDDPFDVHDAVAAIVSPIWPTCEVLVIRTDKAVWSGLPRVPRHRVKNGPA